MSIGPRSLFVLRLRAWLRILWPWMTATLSFVILALVGDEAPAQNGGCARCGAPAMSSSAGLPNQGVRPKTAFVEKRRQKRWTLSASLQVSARRETRGAYTVCVRTCDGSFFPVSYSRAGSRADNLEEVCQALCPNAEVALYSFPFGGTIEQAISASGEPYANLRNASKFEQAYDPNCSCRRQGESWAEALAFAEAKYGHHSSEILVSVEAAERMSRPVQDPAARPADPDQNRAAAVQPPLGLDINGVDTSLRAATATISRESAGIREDDAEDAASYGLNVGHTVEESSPDGSIRHVRVLPSTF
jgi:Protein of unknown function (DUF2865)